MRKEYCYEQHVPSSRHIITEATEFITTTTTTTTTTGVRRSAVGWGTALQAGRSRVRFPIVSTGIFHWHNPSGRTVALGSAQSLTEISARNTSWRVKAAGA